MKKSIEKALNKQLNLEFASSYSYLAMSTYFEDKGLSGLGAWFRRQSQEEHDHMMKIYNFLFQRDQTPVFESVAKPALKGDKTRDYFEEALKQEKKVTQCIHELVDLAMKEKDHATYQFLQWFVEEQVEEEASIKKILDELEILGSDKRALYFLDKELGVLGESSVA